MRKDEGTTPPMGDRLLHIIICFVQPCHVRARDKMAAHSWCIPQSVLANWSAKGKEDA